MGSMTYHVDVSHTHGFHFTAASAHHRFDIDMKGEGGMTPPDVLLASLGSCLGVYIRKYAEGAKLPLESFTVSVDAELSKESPVSFRGISVGIDLKGAALDERRREALLHFIMNCPVHHTLTGCPKIEVSLKHA